MQQHPFIPPAVLPSDPDPIHNAAAQGPKQLINDSDNDNSTADVEAALASLASESIAAVESANVNTTGLAEPAPHQADVSTLTATPTPARDAVPDSTPASAATVTPGTIGQRGKRAATGTPGSASKPPKTQRISRCCDQCHGKSSKCSGFKPCNICA